MRRAALCATLCVLAGCAPVVEYVRVTPECAPPPQPVLPVISGAEVAALPDDVYWRLEDRERRLADWAFEMRAMLGVLCGSDIDRAAPATP